MKTSKSGQSYSNKKIGFVCYEDTRQAQRCIQMYEMMNEFGPGAPLKVDFWQSKQDLQAENQEKQKAKLEGFVQMISNEVRKGQAQAMHQQPFVQGGRGGGQHRGGHRGGQGRGGYQQQQRGGHQGGHHQQRQQPPRQQQQPAQQQGPQVFLPKVDVAQLSSLQGEARNQFVGNNIYASIDKAFGAEFAPRITGMLLDESVVDFQKLLSDQGYFSSKVHEAYHLLVQNNQQ